MTRYSGELNSYSESSYELLDNIVDNVICEGEEIVGSDNEIIFKYCLNNNKGMKFATSADMTVVVSDNFEVISKTSNYSLEEEYVDSIKAEMFAVSAVCGTIDGIVLTTILGVICVSAATISFRKKRKFYYNFG